MENPTQLIAASNLVHVDCFGESTGSIELEVSGGTGSYSYNWVDLINTNIIDDLSSGVYSVIVKDDEDCELSLSFTIEEEAEIISVVTTNSNIGCTQNDIVLSVSGGMFQHQVYINITGTLIH